MRFIKYLKYSVWDYLLCVVMCCSVNITVFSGFYISSEMQYNYVLLIGMAGILCGLLFAGAYDRRSILIAAGAFVVLAAVFLIVARQESGGENIFHDKEGNPYMYFIVAVISTVIVFLLSRTRTGTAILFAAGSFTLAMIQFLYQSDHLIALLLFVLACGALFIYKNYYKSVMESETVKTAFGRMFVLSVVLCLLLTLLSTGVFYGIARVFDPQARELKLITKYMALETLQRVGIADLSVLPDYDKTTENTSEEEQKAKEEKEKKEKEAKGNNKEKEVKNKDQKKPNRLDSNKSPYFYAVNYLRDSHLWLLLPILFILLLAGAVFAKLWMRKRWLRKLEPESNRIKVVEMYKYYMKRLRRMKIKKAPEDTPYQFVEKAESSLQHFTAEGADFQKLTDLFVRASYGKEEITDKDFKGYLNFHQAFYKNCREYLGKFKYILKFFYL